jgi:hypothetical protein
VGWGIPPHLALAEASGRRGKTFCNLDTLRQRVRKGARRSSPNESLLRGLTLRMGRGLSEAAGEEPLTGLILLGALRLTLESLEFFALPAEFPVLLLELPLLLILPVLLALELIPDYAPT